MLHESRKLTAEGIEAAKNRRQLQAEALLSDALVLDPENEEALLWLSRVAVRPEDRRASLEKLVALNPANEAARVALHATQRHPQGEAGLRALIARAESATAGGARRGALAAWKAVLDFDPGNEQAVSAVVRLLGPDHRPQARALVQRALTHNPHNGGLKLLYAEALAESNRWDDVKRVLLTVHPRDLSAAQAFERMGRLHLSAGQMTAAREAFARAVELPDHAPLTHFQLARLLDREGKTDRAVVAYREVVDRAWGTPEARQAEQRLREISPYLPRSVADSWPFILREAAGWVVFVFLLAVMDSGVRVAGMSASGVAAIMLAAIGGTCWAVSGAVTGTVRFFGARAIGQGARRALHIAGVALCLAAVALGLFNSLRSTALLLARIHSG
ncbi:MAG: hypothetical protein Kow00120_04050 [Anaerolineae bacterium]